jgi:hypothetical protein
MQHYVFNTDVVVAAIGSPTGASAALNHRITICASVALMVKYEAACSRTESLVVSGISEKDTGIFLESIAALIHPIETHFLWRPQLKDPGGEMVLEAAVNG